MAGRPKIGRKQSFGDSDWSDLCRQPLLWLGCADPAVSVFEAMAEDPDRENAGSPAERLAYGIRPDSRHGARCREASVVCW